MSISGSCAPQGAFSFRQGLVDLRSHAVPATVPAPTLSNVAIVLDSVGIRDRAPPPTPPQQMAPVQKVPETSELAALAQMAAAYRSEAAATQGYGTTGSVPRGMMVDRLA